MHTSPTSRTFLRPLAAVLALATSAGLLRAQSTLWVDDDGPGEPAGGQGNPFISDALEDGSAAHPFDRLSEAIAAAASGDTILVRPSNPEYTGLHYFEIGTIDLSGPGAGKTLTIRSTDGPAVTVFQWAGGQPDNPMFRADSGETSSFLFEGFTLRDADNGSSATLADFGGALVISGASPTIRDCRFEGNHAYSGGAAYVANSSSLFEDCTFTGNDVVHQGGAILTENGAPTFSRCRFTGNVASFGGAFLSRTTGGGSPRVLDGLFYQNTALVGYAGALAKFDGGSITVERTRFLSNTAAMQGGGMLTNGPAEIWDCVFDSNAAGSPGQGGGLHVSTSTCRVYGSTFTNNMNGGVSEGGGVVVSELHNCIVWDNVGSEVGPNVSVQYCDVLGGYAGTGNIDADPLFVDPFGLDGVRGTLDDNLSLMRESPCIDAGNALLHAQRTPHVPYPLDVAGNPRVVNHPSVPDTGIPVLGQSVDMGALERFPRFLPFRPSQPE